MGNLMRMTGFSGLDIEGMVAQLMRAERVRHDRLFQQSILLGWRQEAFITASTALSTFQNNFLRSTPAIGAANNSATASNRAISDPASWRRDMITSSSSTAVGITATSNATAGDFSVMVNRLATRNIFESNVNQPFSNEVSGTLNVAALQGLTAGGYFEVSFNGATRQISFTDAEIATIQGSGNPLAAFETALNNRLEQAFGTASGASGQRVSASISGGQISFNVANGNDIIAISSGDLDVENLFGIGAGQATNSMANRSVTSVLGLAPGSEHIFTINNQEIRFDDNTTVQQLLTMVNQSGAGVSMGFNNATGQFTLQSNQTGAANNINFGGGVNDNFDFRTAFRFGGPTEVAQDAEFTVNGQVFTSATNTGVNALGLTLNLNEVTSSAVTVTVRNNVQAAFNMIMEWMEGYNATLRALTGLTHEQRARTNTGGFYHPLTEEQRRGMSDADIARWEAEARKGVLRNDPTLQRIEQEMRRWIFEPVTLSDGRQISLHEIGISTGDWRNGGQLELWQNHRGETVFTMELLEERFDDIMAMFTQQSTTTPWSNMPNTPATAPGLQNQRMRDNGIAARLDDIINNAIANQRSDLNRTAGINRNGQPDATNQNSPMNMQMRDIQRRMADAILQMNRRENQFFAMFGRMEQAIMRADQQMASLMGAMGF